MNHLMITALIKKYWKLLVSTLIVSALGCAVIISLSGTKTSLSDSLYRYVDEYEYPDGVITTEVVSKDTVATLEKAEGIERIVARMCADSIMINASGRYVSIRAFSYRDDDFEKMVFWEKAEPTEVDSILVEVKFARNNGIKAGDNVSIKVGDEFRSYHVTGLISMPETLVAQPTDESWGSNSDFGYVFASEELLAKEPNPEIDDANKQIGEKQDELDKTEKDATAELEDAQQKLDDAKTTLEEEKKKFEDAKHELADTLSQLEEAKKELEKGKTELAEKKLEIIEKQEEGIKALKELKDTKKTLLEQKTDVLEKQAELEKKKKEVADLKKDLIEKKAQAESALKQIAEAEATEKQLKEALPLLKQAKEGLEQIDSATADINSQLAEYTTGDVADAVKMIRSLSPDLKFEDLSKVESQLESYLDMIEKYSTFTAPKTLNELKEINDIILNDHAYFSGNFTSLIKDIKNDKNGGAESEEAKALLAAIGRYNSDVVIRTLTYSLSLAKGNNSRLYQAISIGNVNEKLAMVGDNGSMTFYELYDMIYDLMIIRSQFQEITGNDYSTIGEMLSDYDSKVKEANDALSELSTKRAEVISQLTANGVKESEIASKIKECEDGLAEIEKNRKTMTEGKKTATDGLKQIEDGFAQIKAGEDEIAKYEPQIKDGLKQLEDGLKQVDDGITQLEDLLKQAEDGLAQIEDGEKELEKNADDVDEGIKTINEQLDEGEKKLSEAEEELEKNETELEQSWMDARTQFADARKEIEKAIKELGEFKGYDYLCNQFLIKVKDGYDNQAVLDEALALLGDTKVKSSYTFENSAIKERMDVNIQPIEQMSKFMPVVFFVITLVVVFLFMSLIIKQSRREIGILRAMGFTVGRVRVIYCLLNLVSSVGAIALGIGIGLAVMHYIGSYFEAFFALPVYYYRIEAKTIIFASVFTIVTGQLATLIGTGVIGKVHPSEAMSRPAPAAASLPGWLSKITGKLNPVMKFCVTSLFRNKLRFCFSVICISASVMMIYSSFAFISSKNQMLTEYYDQRTHYDAQIFMNVKPDKEMLDALSSQEFVSDVYEQYYYSLNISCGGKKEKALVNAMDPACKLVGLYTKDGTALDMPDNGIVLDTTLAEKLGVSEGSTVEVGGKSMTVSKIDFQSISRVQYIPMSEAEGLGGASFYCIICKVSKENEQKLIEYMTENDDYIFTLFVSVLKEGDKRNFATYDAIAWILIGFAVILGLIIIVNTTNTNLLEQKKELCVLRTLGFQHSELSRQWFIQSLLQFICSVIIGLISGGFIARVSLENLSNEAREYVYANGTKEYVLTVALVFAFIVVSHIIAMRSLKKWDMVETVKEKE